MIVAAVKIELFDLLFQDIYHEVFPDTPLSTETFQYAVGELCNKLLEQYNTRAQEETVLTDVMSTLQEELRSMLEYERIEKISFIGGKTFLMELK